MAYQTIDPSNEQTLRIFLEHTDKQLEDLIARAQSTYQNEWSKSTFAGRRTVIKNGASILRKRRSDFAGLVTLETGKLLREAGEEVDRYLESHAEARPEPRTFNATGSPHEN